MEKFRLPDGTEIESRTDNIAGIAEEALIPLGSLARLLTTDDMHETVYRNAAGDIVESLHKKAVEEISSRFNEIQDKLGHIRLIYATGYRRATTEQAVIRPGDLLAVIIEPPIGKEGDDHDNA